MTAHPTPAGVRIEPALRAPQRRLYRAEQDLIAANGTPRLAAALRAHALAVVDARAAEDHEGRVTAFARGDHDGEDYAARAPIENTPAAPRRTLDAILVIVLGLAVAVGAYGLAVGWASTGPDCPGNPGWLGYCADAPVRGER